MIITFISDTHNKYDELHLVGGDILIHCGDAVGSSYGREKRIKPDFFILA